MLKIMTTQNFEAVLHFLLIFSVAVENSNIIMIRFTLYAVIFFSSLEACRIFPLPQGSKFHNAMNHVIGLFSAVVT